MIPKDQRTRSRLITAALGSAALSTVCLALVTPALAKSPCDAADALQGAGLLPEASLRYQKLSALPQPPPCAQRGIKALDKERSRRARELSTSLESFGVSDATVTSLVALVRSGNEKAIPSLVGPEIRAGRGFDIAVSLKKAGYAEAAKRVLVEAIAADPTAEVPEELRATSDAHLHLEAAKALSDAGLDAEANTEVALALKENPSLPVPDKLASPKREQPFWRSWLGAVGPWIVTIAEMTIGVLATVGLVLLVCRVPGRFGVRLVIDPFTGGNSTTAASEAGTTAGSDMTAAVRENYGRLRETHGGQALKMVSSSGEASIGLPPEVTQQYPQAALIAALVGFIDRLFPSRTRQAIGYLRPRDLERGVGVTVTLKRRYGKVFDEITIWESDYRTPITLSEGEPKQNAYDRLAVPAATWLMYETGNLTLRRRLGRRLGRLGAVPQSLPPSFWEFQILATKDWRSYALFAVGAEIHDRGDVGSARRLYLKALNHDPANRGANFNLAVADLEGAGE
jgi:hypothetical protein